MVNRQWLMVNDKLSISNSYKSLIFFVVVGIVGARYIVPLWFGRK
jgi:hypothetical protein